MALNAVTIAKNIKIVVQTSRRSDLLIIVFFFQRACISGALHCPLIHASFEKCTDVRFWSLAAAPTFLLGEFGSTELERSRAHHIAKRPLTRPFHKSSTLDYRRYSATIDVRLGRRADVVLARS